MVISNNYDKLEIAIQNKQVNFLAQNRKDEFIIPTSIKYRSVECFDLLINALPDNNYTIHNLGFYQAFEYYSDAPNSKNKYFVEKLKSISININININLNLNIKFFTKNMFIFNEFSQHILNNNAPQYLNDYDMDIMVYEAIFNYCLDNNLLHHNKLSDIIEKSLIKERIDIIEIIKNTKYIHNIFNYCPNIFNYEMPNSLLSFFVNLYNVQKPNNVNIQKSVMRIIKNHMSIYDNYCITFNKKKLDNIIQNIDILLQLNIDDFNTNYLNEQICHLITYPWKQMRTGGWTYRLQCHHYMRFNIMLLLRFIERSPSFVLNLSTIESKYFDLIINADTLKKGLKTLINELIKLKKTIPQELYFIINDDTIVPFDISKKKS